MDNEQKKTADIGKADVRSTRTKDNPIGTDDIGLPGGIRDEDANRLQDIRPDPDKAQDKRP